jgi:hypothetical protein
MFNTGQIECVSNLFIGLNRQGEFRAIAESIGSSRSDVVAICTHIADIDSASGVATDDVVSYRVGAYAVVQADASASIARVTGSTCPCDICTDEVANHLIANRLRRVGKLDATPPNAGNHIPLDNGSTTNAVATSTLLHMHAAAKPAICGRESDAQRVGANEVSGNQIVVGVYTILMNRLVKLEECNSAHRIARGSDHKSIESAIAAANLHQDRGTAGIGGAVWRGTHLGSTINGRTSAQIVQRGQRAAKLNRVDVVARQRKVNRVRARMSIASAIAARNEHSAAAVAQTPSPGEVSGASATVFTVNTWSVDIAPRIRDSRGSQDEYVTGKPANKSTRNFSQHQPTAIQGINATWIFIITVSTGSVLQLKAPVATAQCL